MDSSINNERKMKLNTEYQGHIAKLAALLASVFVLAALPGCYKLEPHGYRQLAPITINTASDTINVNLGTELVYNGLDIVSSKEMTFEWAYGVRKSGSAANQFESMEVISTSRTIDYTFSKVGSFLLRLKVDNGESIEFKYFTLNVNSGYDEGVAILSNDEEGNGSLTFVKTLTSEESAKGDQQVFTNIFSVEGANLKNGTSLYMSDNTYSGVTYSGFLIATDDEDGTIYHMDCKTFELYMTAKMKSDYGTNCLEFGGEYAEDKAAFGCFFRSSDNRLFRYDMNGGFVNEVVEATFNINRIVDGPNKTSASTSKTYRYPIFFNGSTVGGRKNASGGVRTLKADGWEVVNVAVERVTSTSSNYPVYILYRKTESPDSCMIKIAGNNCNTFGSRKVDGKSVEYAYKFRAPDLKMDSDSKIVANRVSSDVYYVYDNAIYRWGLTTAPGSRPAITLPQGEQIRDIATNFKGRKATEGEDLLYVATYNPGRSGEHKGSLYVYRYTDDTLVKSYEGICDDPASVIYKYRIN